MLPELYSVVIVADVLMDPLSKVTSAQLPTNAKHSQDNFKTMSYADWRYPMQL